MDPQLLTALIAFVATVFALASVVVGQLLQLQRRTTREQLAFDLPPVARLVVGANTPARLRALLGAIQLRVDAERIAAYREILRRRALSC